MSEPTSEPEETAAKPPEAVEAEQAAEEAVAPESESAAAPEEKPVAEKSAALPVEGAPVEEKAADEAPAEEKPAAEAPAEEKPTEEKPAAEKPAAEKPAAEKPAEEKPAEAPVAAAAAAVAAPADKPAATPDRPGGGPGGDRRRGGRQGGFQSRFGGPPSDEKPEFEEKVVFINRCAKVVKGGRRFSFSALVVSGNREGKVGYGFGKANEVAECIRKASDASKKNMIKVPMNDNTIPHEVVGEFGGGKVLLRPASPGTGIIAGGGVRAVIEASGIRDILAKSLGSNNHANVVKATLAALTSLRTRDEVYKLRGKKRRDKQAL